MQSIVNTLPSWLILATVVFSVVVVVCGFLAKLPFSARVQAFFRAVGCLAYKAYGIAKGSVTVLTGRTIYEALCTARGTIANWIDLPDVEKQAFDLAAQEANSASFKVSKAKS